LKKVASLTQLNESLSHENAELRGINETLEREREFYFEKLVGSSNSSSSGGGGGSSNTLITAQ